jgi:hypothetical protein
MGGEIVSAGALLKQWERFLPEQSTGKHRSMTALCLFVLFVLFFLLILPLIGLRLQRFHHMLEPGPFVR